ncbi:Hypothetical protein PHPALM_20785, partial [Phytophthora palmivora]
MDLVGLTTKSVHILTKDLYGPSLASPSGSLTTRSKPKGYLDEGYHFKVEDTGAGAGNSGGLPPGSDVSAHEGRDSNVDSNDNNTSSLGKDAKVDNSEAAGATPHTSGAPSEATRPIGGLITLDQSLKLAMTGILPKDGSNTADDSEKAPSRYVLPTPRGLDENTFLVGVPAHLAAYRAGAYVQNGYGGTETVMVFDELTNQDLDDLSRMLGNHVEVREMTLRPDVEREPPSVVNLEITLNSLSMRREMASILTQFLFGRLAERLFYTVSLLHRVLEYHRSQDSTQSSGGVTIQDTTLRSKYDSLCCDFGFLEKYREQEAAAVRTEMETIKANLEGDFGSMTEERAALESRLNVRIQKLEGQLEDANRTISRLKQDNRTALDADKLMAFLNDHGNNIRVEAVDKPFRMVPPYPGPLRSDSEANDDEGAPSGDTLEQEEKSEDLKQSHPTSQLMRLTSMKSQDGDIEVQFRPSTHPESDKRALPHDGISSTMSFGYALSVEMMGEDKIAHHQFPEASLVDMLIQMMYHRCLDETKWTKYAPEYYYTLAELWKECTERKLRLARATSKQDQIRHLRSDDATKRAVQASIYSENLLDPSMRKTKHCFIRLSNVLFSDRFAERLAHSDDALTRDQIEAGAVNVKTVFWKEVGVEHRTNKRDYNNLFEAAASDPRFSGNSSFVKANAKFYVSGQNSEDFYEFCDGNLDAAYLE